MFGRKMRHGALGLMTLALLVFLVHGAPARTPEAVLKRIPPRVTLDGADVYVYKRIGDTALRLYVFQPATRPADEPVPAVIFFYGGAWMTGDVTQFAPQAHYFASRGMVAVLADYRVSRRHGSTWFDSVRDAKSAVRWVRQHAEELGIDPQRIVAAGGSAGGHLAAATALVEGYDDEAPDVSAKPNALVLFNPALDLLSLPVPAHWLQGAEKISPLHLVQEGAPPTLIMHGTADKVVPFAQSERFCAAMVEAGNRCELVAYPGRGHGFFNYRSLTQSDFVDTVLQMDRFLVSLGYLR